MFLKTGRCGVKLLKPLLLVDHTYDINGFVDEKLIEKIFLERGRKLIIKVGNKCS
jgi:hypothetical protein